MVDVKSATREMKRNQGNWSTAYPRNMQSTYDVSFYTTNGNLVIHYNNGIYLDKSNAIKGNSISGTVFLAVASLSIITCGYYLYNSSRKNIPVEPYRII